MSNVIHRRDFMKTAGLAAAALPLGASTLQGGAPELIKNMPGHPRLLSGCCAYSYRKYLQNGPMTMEDFILAAVELEIEGVDMTTYYLKSTEPSYLLGLRRLAFRNGVPFSGAAIGTNMCQPDPGKRAAESRRSRRGSRPPNCSAPPTYACLAARFLRAPATNRAFSGWWKP